MKREEDRMKKVSKKIKGSVEDATGQSPKSSIIPMKKGARPYSDTEDGESTANNVSPGASPMAIHKKYRSFKGQAMTTSTAAGQANNMNESISTPASPFFSSTRQYNGVLADSSENPTVGGDHFKQGL